MHHWLILSPFTVIVLATVLQLIASQELVADDCTSDFYLLERSLLVSSHNRFQLLKTFFPAKDAQPVIVEVTYKFGNRSVGNESSLVWYWSISEFYFVQPLEIFQYTSLFFANLEYRQSSIDLQLPAECAEADDEKMEFLTQRLQLYSQSATTSPNAVTQRVSGAYIAVAASRKEIESDAILSDFVKVWLHLFLVLFPVGTVMTLYLCAPVKLLLGEKTSQKLEDESNHPTIAALIQLSVLFTMFVFFADIMGFVATLRGDFLAYDNNSAFYLSVVTGVVFDVAAFVCVMVVLATSCHWDFKNMWHKWRRQRCRTNTSERIRKLLRNTLFAAAICLANHLHYIVLACLSDPFHAGSIGIFYFFTLALFYIAFKQFYARMALRNSKGEQIDCDCTPAHMTNTDELSESAKPLTGQNSLQLTESHGTVSESSKPYSGPQRTAFNTQVVIVSMFVLGPILMLYVAVFMVLFLTLPIAKTLEASPTRINTIFQGSGFLIVALLTYNIILRPNAFSLTRAIQKIAKELHIPERIQGWNRLSDEEKFAQVVRVLYGRQQEKEGETDKNSDLAETTV